ncbi:hypothetical protein KUTeg_018910 [Tegillarca granosa]|uniref:COL6A n=1 Tax=Tegillarca granosa TaxID=220873 RepID=A0ABQ9EAZ6_TEGGR|nr:hypothetical protein KUTeg_018910 [Tegillarca granosa]
MMCEDKLPDCKDYGSVTYACSGNYEHWAMENCRKYCGFCGKKGLQYFWFICLYDNMGNKNTTIRPFDCKVLLEKSKQDKLYTNHAEYATFLVIGGYITWNYYDQIHNFLSVNTVSYFVSGQTSNSTTVINCANLKADIQVLVDASPSIGISNFRKIKNFIYNFTNNLVIGNGNVLLGVTTYSDIIRSNFSMNKYENKDILLEAISNITYANIGVTHTGAAINFTVHSSFTEKHGDRRNVQNILIMFTDGISSKTTSASALELVNSKIHSFVVGVGNFSRSVLEEIASGSDKVLRLENVSKLYSLTPFSACMQT